MECSLQLYSLACGGIKSLKERINLAGQHGYDGIEFAGFSDLSIEEIKAEMDKYGLYSKSAHTGFLGMTDEELEETFEFHKALGIEYVIIPYHNYESIDDALFVAKRLNEASIIAKKYGIKVGYHNHAHEFEKFDGKYILDIIKENCNDDIIFELDIFWVSKGGEDAYKFIEKYGKAVELVHLKQIDKDGNNCDIPDGILDINKVREIAKYAKYFIVEQEATGDSVASSKRNAEYLKSL